MMSKRISVNNGFVGYRIEKERAVITGFEGFETNLVLPPQIEGYPVAVLDRKAFLSRKSLCSILVPDSMEEVGDWAFAHCDSLREISFPRRKVRFGRDILKGCGNLERIAVRDPGESEGEEKRAAESTSFRELLAASVTMLDAGYLLDLPAAGSEAWLEQWDIRLRSILRSSDTEGYISQSVYGEEDYIGMDLEEYICERRREKVRLSFLRLLHPQKLHPSLKEELEQYLRSLTKGKAGEETWQVLRQERGGCREYYELFAGLGCITKDNLDGILTDTGEENPEMKAFFLKYMGERQEGTLDFFRDLEL